MHYVANIDFAFLSLEHIMRDVKGGFILRYLHANGASLVFIFFLMMGTAFVGYVLPWGQMSF